MIMKQIGLYLIIFCYYTGWSNSLCASDDYNRECRCTETFWSPCTARARVCTSLCSAYWNISVSLTVRLCASNEWITYQWVYINIDLENFMRNMSGCLAFALGLTLLTMTLLEMQISICFQVVLHLCFEHNRFWIMKLFRWLVWVNS